MDVEEFTLQVIETFHALEGAFRRADPMMLPQIRQELLRYEDLPASDRESFPAQVSLAADKALEAIRIFGSGDDPTRAFVNVLKAHRKFSRAQEALFTLRHEIARVNQYFLEPDARQSVENAGRGDREGLTGIFHAGSDEERRLRGGYSLFVPEQYEPGRARPLIVALHGGNGHGRDFLWTWLREARSRGYMLLSPTSVGRTWSILRIDEDAGPLMHHLEEVQSRYSIDSSRILVTGMSDGATFALGMCLREGSPFKAIAPVSGVLPPMDLGYAKGRRIHWVHGALDWMFPVKRAAQGCRALKDAGAEVSLKVIRDLSHAYPREENSGILSWFASDPLLPASQ
jgi:phospholipase/carboxylesterase